MQILHKSVVNLTVYSSPFSGKNNIAKNMPIRPGILVKLEIYTFPWKTMDINTVSRALHHKKRLRP
jgi:hypothetical protein